MNHNSFIQSFISFTLCVILFIIVKMETSEVAATATPRLSKKLDQTSRQLVKLLRHKIVEMGFTCDARGFVAVNDLFGHPRANLHNTIQIPDDLILIVQANEKKRLELEQRENGEYYMRAVQGHSGNVGDLLDENEAFERVTEPVDFCAHGTEQRFAESILAEGLKRMSRKHIHLVSEVHEDRQVSGYKKVSNAVVIIDMARCLADGMVFLRAANGVILTEGFDGLIPPQYIKEIICR